MKFAGTLLIIVIASMASSCGGGPGILLDCPTVQLRVHDSSCDRAYVSWEIWMVTWEDHGQNVMALPWLHEQDLCSGEVEIWARRECTDDGTVTVEILVDGRLERSSQGHGSRANAYARLWID